ncbi:MAG TPA: hypothetical protein VNB49_04045 [Candidatus Dormibacteraeota bacterium]|nr:hypothetical protein [Candidatus Dormibacteraeota bacterium]
MKVAQTVLLTGFVALVGVRFSSLAAAQAPPGPVTAPPPGTVPAVKAPEPVLLPPPRQTILGAWVLNRDESDDPRSRMRDSEDSGGYGGRRGGTGWPGGGGSRGGYGGESDGERQKMHEYLSPPTNIAFSMTGAEVDLKDDHDRKRAFMTDGRKLQKSKDDNYQEIAAKWDGNRLVTDEKNPRGGRMSRAFELSPDGRQLYETFNLKLGRNNYETSIRFVYDIPAQTVR